MNFHDDLEYREALKLQMRKISDEHRQKFEGHAAEIFSAFGMDVNSAARQPPPLTRTMVWRGNYAEDPSLRSEFFTACGLQKNEM